jgi:hypothetical protein
MKTVKFMVCREAVYAYFADEAKNMDTMCGQSVEFQNAEITTKL